MKGLAPAAAGLSAMTENAVIDPRAIEQILVLNVCFISVFSIKQQFVAIINKVAGYNLFDIQCTDAGTRFIRLENSFNLKNPNLPRPVRVIEMGDE